MTQPFRDRCFAVSCIVSSAMAVGIVSLRGDAAPKATPKSPASVESFAALTANPPSISLKGPYTETRLLLTGVTRAGKSFDVSGRAAIEIADPQVATIDEFGIVRPARDGRTTLVARQGGFSVKIPVSVSGIANAGPPRFAADVIPVLTRAGCNLGACHGAGSGKAGFKLSLLGYDPEADYPVIARGAFQRRIARTQPENSLLIRKATLRVAHKGGQRFRVGSPEYRLLCDWIAWGMPAPKAEEPLVDRLEVIPAVKTMGVGQTQRFAVRAKLTDGTVRDVTGEAVFAASDESVAKVTADGEAKATGFGEGAVLVRYRDVVATARVVSPFASVAEPKNANIATVPVARISPGARRSDTSLVGTARAERRRGTHAAPYSIDSLIQRKLDALNLTPSGRCTDSDFLRRAYLDVIGVLPTPEEARAFLANGNPNKRDKLIDTLFERAEYVDFWTLKWGDLLRSSRKFLSERGLVAFNSWIRRSVMENKPWDQFARELILATGSTYEGPANYFRTASTPETLAETTSQAFLGVRIQCARCHNHPYEKWRQNQYYQMAAFFAQVHTRRGLTPEENFVTVSNSGEVRHPKTNKEVIPCALDASPVPAGFTGDRREVLAAWLASPKNPFFSRILVNRVWRHFMGRGLVEPVDDIRVTNPPSNEPLLNHLAQDFSSHGFDLQYLMKSILRSEAYQRSVEPANGNERDTKYYSHYYFKRLSAEQLEDALASATGVAEKFAGYPQGLHAAQLMDAAVPSYFLDLFGRPARNITCECERNDEPNLGQVLHLMNNKGINERVSSKNGRVAALTASKKTDREIINELYLASISRHPSPDEFKKTLAAFARAKTRQMAGEDLLWVLANSKEFLFNH